MITKINAFNFRNYDELNFNFTKNIVLLYGSNNVGKTSILETIYFSTFEKSFRTNYFKDLIKKNKEHTFISVEYKNNKIDSTNVITLNIKESVLQHLLNQKGLNLRDFRNFAFPIFLNKAYLEEFEKSKKVRWEFLNNLISIDKKVYLPLIKDFEKLFTTYKNSLDITSYHNTLRLSISEQLVNLEDEILKLRRNFFSKINKYLLENSIRYLNEKIGIEYKTFFKNKDDLTRGLNEKKIITIVNDELVIVNNGNEYVNTISKKDRNFINLLFFISVIEYVQYEYNQEFPLLLDDLLSEIDERNYVLFFEIIKEKNINAFITNNIENKIPVEVLENVQIVKF